MASIQGVKTQIQEANALGVQNLTEKGVEISADATTYEIMQSILNIAGGGTEYKDITFASDDEIKLTDDKDIVHTIAFSKDINGKIKSMSFDGDKIDIAYNDTSISVGATDITFPETEFTEVIFNAEGKTYETMLVRKGNSYEPPRTVPRGEDGSYLTYWTTDGENPASFPAVASGDTQRYVGKFSTLVQMLYEHFGVSADAYKYVFLCFGTSGTPKNIRVIFCDGYVYNNATNSIIGAERPCLDSYVSFSSFPADADWQRGFDNVETTIKYVVENEKLNNTYDLKGKLKEKLVANKEQHNNSPPK
jgi:hypothetical protein